MSNMQLEDLLEILARVGTVTLKRIRDPRTATPSVPVHTGWTCEITLPGYNNSGGTMTHVRGLGMTGTEAANACHDALETYLAGKQARTDRKRYLDSHAVRVSLSRTTERSQFNRTQHPGRIAPEAKLTA